MSSKRKNGRRKEYAPQLRQASVSAGSVATKSNWWAKLLERLQRFLPHTQEDEMAKLRRIMIFIVVLVVIEFTVIAVVLSSNPPVLQNKNAGQTVPLNSNSSSACSTDSNNLYNAQSPGASLQNSPSTQNPVSGADVNGNLQAAPQSAQCM